MRRLCLVFLIAVLCLAPTAALGQTAVPTLVLSAPANGATTGPDVTVVVGLSGSASQAITFAVLVDDAASLLENPSNGATSMTARVAAGARTSVILRGVPEGTHAIKAVAVPEGAATASSSATFQVSARGFNLVLLLASIGVLLVFVAYRRRILGPWADRYERRSGDAGPSDDG